VATITFFPEGAFGPTNNCVGIGDVLRRRGHEVVFIVEESFAGNLEAKGFAERRQNALGDHWPTADVELMQRLIDTLGETDHRVIVSMGPQHDGLRLADNMVGEEFLPQTTILPLVDLVVTHGGNNTVTECFWAGKPMVLLPLFWDQYDNAQRVDETGFGIRLDTYGHEPYELTGAIDRLLADERLRAHLAAASERLSARPGTEVAADKIERIATS
jgi:UDP:flavonoid glycosyltransferase YjiC (YdhE family)